MLHHLHIYWIFIGFALCQLQLRLIFWPSSQYIEILPLYFGNRIPSCLNSCLCPHIQIKETFPQHGKSITIDFPHSACQIPHNQVENSSINIRPPVLLGQTLHQNTMLKYRYRQFPRFLPLILKTLQQHRPQFLQFPIIQSHQFAIQHEKLATKIVIDYSVDVSHNDIENFPLAFLEDLPINVLNVGHCSKKI